MKLENVDINSSTWIKIKDHLNERLNALRLQNDGDKTPDETSKLRGRIAELKMFLAIGEPVQYPDQDADG